MLNKKWVGGCNEDESVRAGGRECEERVTGGGGSGGRGAAGQEAAVPRLGAGGPGRVRRVRARQARSPGQGQTGRQLGLTYCRAWPRTTLPLGLRLPMSIRGCERHGVCLMFSAVFCNTQTFSSCPAGRAPRTLLQPPEALLVASPPRKNTLAGTRTLLGACTWASTHSQVTCKGLS